jgi:hypothetical protein
MQCVQMFHTQFATSTYIVNTNRVFKFKLQTVAGDTDGASNW